MNQAYSSFNTFLKAFGVDNNDYLGGGNFSRVYKTNRNTVIKFTVDEKYIEYVRSFAGKDNSLAPEVVNDFGVVGKLLEDSYDGGKRYNKCVDIYALELPLYTEVYSLGKWGDNTDPKKYAKLSRSIQLITSMLYKDVVNDWESFEESLAGYKSDLEDLQKSGCDIMDVIDLTATIKSIVDSGRAFVDLCTGNCMIDGSGNLRITDPIASRSTVSSVINSSFDYELEDVFKEIDFDSVKSITKLLGTKSSKDFVDFMAKVHYNAVNESILWRVV